MSTEQSVDPELVEQTKQQIRNLVREIAQISKSEVAPADFYDAVLTRIVTALAAAGGAVWSVAETGQLMLEYQINLRDTRLADPDSEEEQIKHARLLRKVIASGEGMLAAPNSGSGNADDGGNPTDFLLVLGPLKTANETTAGVMEIFQRPGASATVQQGYKRFLLQMCEIASEYLKSRKLQSYTDRQALWAQLENFTRMVHRGLDVRGVAYTIANEGRRLIECDRVSVAIKRGRKCTIEAVSGQDMFDKRSNTIVALSHLANAVVAIGETVWYTGDTSMMAPQVEEAVQEYVDECHSKAVAVVPLKEPHDPQDPTAKPRVLGALIIEQIEDSRPRQGLSQRIDVVSEHSAIALANATEHNELFLMPVWRAIGKSRWVVEARQLPYTISITLGVLATLLFLALFPANFDLTARGTLQPVVKRETWADMDAEVVEVHVKHLEDVKKGQPLAQLRNTTLETEIAQLSGELQSQRDRLQNTAVKLDDRESLRRISPLEIANLQNEKLTLQTDIASTDKRLALREAEKEKLTLRSPIDGQVVTWDVERQLLNMRVNRGQSLISVIDPAGKWELELLMPEEKMGYVNDARAKLGDGLSVEYILATRPGDEHEGTVREYGGTAEVRGEDGNTILLRVAIDENDIPPKLRKPGSSVTAQVHCGRASIGYVWLHDLISFVQKGLFRFF